MSTIASFSFEGHTFKKIFLNLENKASNNLQIVFDPSGEFISDTSIFNLKFNFQAKSEGSEESFINIDIRAIFKFENVTNLDEIPAYFWRNSIAIVFPYIRAFVSTLTLQANIPPVLLPTMNLSSLEPELKKNTVII